MSGISRYASTFGGTRKRVVGVALGLLWLTLRDRHAERATVSAIVSYQPVVVEAASSAQRRGGSEIPVCQRGLGTPDAPK